MTRRIFIDADACPVKAEAERVATRHGVKMLLVSNGGIRPSQNPLVESVFVAGFKEYTRLSDTARDEPDSGKGSRHQGVESRPRG